MKLDMLQPSGCAQNEESAFCVFVEVVEANGDELLASGVAYAGQEVEQSPGVAQVDGVESVVHVEGLNVCMAGYEQKGEVEGRVHVGAWV